MTRVRRTGPADDGNAIVEFVFVAVLILVPLVYLLVAVVAVQRARVAASTAAREAGRAFATSDTRKQAGVRSSAAARIAFADQGLTQTAPYYVAPGASCDSAHVTPALARGAQFTVCVRRQVQIPAVPGLLRGRGITVVGRYNVHVDEFRVTR